MENIFFSFLSLRVGVDSLKANIDFHKKMSCSWLKLAQVQQKQFCRNQQQFWRADIILNIDVINNNIVVQINVDQIHSESLLFFSLL